MKINKIALPIVLIFAFLCSLLVGVMPSVSFAEESTANVLEDLKKDNRFKESDYPVIIGDYSLKVIQIAESTNKELLIYVYQPAGNTRPLQAKSITMSRSIDNYAPNNYKLTLLSRSGVFHKYKVENVKVNDDEVRYYDIYSILRAYDKNIDSNPTGDNTIVEVPYKVGKLWTVTSNENGVDYVCTDIETIEITDKYTGFIRYYNGWQLYRSSCDSHYVAFSTDKRIDKLMEAEVYYVQRDVTEKVNLTGKHPTYGKPEDKTVIVRYTDCEVNNPVSGLFGHKYSWDRIETAGEFINNDKLSDEAKNKIADKEWVLSFIETDYKEGMMQGLSGISYNYYTEVTDVMILRLKFETDGVVYNLGVVDNKQTGSLSPSNNTNNLLEMIKRIVITIFFAILFLIAFPFIVKFIVWLITYPFDLAKGKK